MIYYPSLQLVKKDLRDPQSKIYQNKIFYYKCIPCEWADSSFDRLRCDPYTLQMYKDFYRLKNHLEPKIIVDLS